MGDSSKFVCEKCNQSFKQSAGLSRHRKTCNSSDPKLYQCNTCLKTFTRKDSLMKHINKGRCKTQGFPCQQCEKVFKSSWYLNRHLQVHDPKKEYECESCKKTYVREKSYLSHKCMKNFLHINVSSLTNQVSHEIAMCNKDSFDESGLYSYDETEEEEMTVDEEFPSMIDFSKKSMENNEPIEEITKGNEGMIEEDQIVPETFFSDEMLKELKNDATLRKTKSRVAEKVAELIQDSNLKRNDSLDTMILSLKKLDLFDQMKERITGDTKLRSKRGRKRTPFSTCNQVWEFWHAHSSASTLTSRPAKMKIGNRPKLQSGLSFVETVELVKKRNVDHFQSQWFILNKTYRQLYSEYLVSNEHVSYGTFLTLKPFYIRAATTKDFEVCCCKLHLEVRWLVDAILKLSATQLFSSYDDFFQYLYGDCVCHDEEQYIHVKWDCTPDKKSICSEIRKHWEDLSNHLSIHSNDLTIDFMHFEKVKLTSNSGKEYTKLKAVTKCVNMSFLLNFMEGRLSKMIHHRNQLKYFKGTKPLVLDNLNAVEIEIDFSENLDKPLKHEPQSLHWSSDQVTVHSGIHFVNGEKNFHIHISDDLTHDQAFVDVVTERILDAVDDDVDGKVVVICSDNCAAQYKSAQNFYDLQKLADKVGTTVIRIYGIANHGKGQVDCVGGTAKIAIRNEVARAETYYSSAAECVAFLKKKFGDKTNPKYFVEEITSNELTEKRDTYRFINFKTVDGSSTFQVIVFTPFSTTIKAAPRLCICEMCTESFGSCNLFKTFEPVVMHLKRPSLRSECLDAVKAAEKDDDDATIDDFYLPGSVCAMISDSNDTESFWLISIVAVREASQNRVDEYNHHVIKDQKFLECNYFEKEDKTRKGHVYRKDKKTAFVFKESIIYPYVNLQQCGDKYFLTDQDYCEVLMYIERAGFTHL